MEKWVCVLLGALIGAMMVFPGEAALAALAALRLFAFSIVPTLCPYLCCMLLLSSRLRLPIFLQIPLCWLCGSPGGAKLMQRQVLKGREALRAAALSGTMSPMFFLSTLSAWLGSPGIGRLLLFCHLLGAVLTGLTIRKGEKNSILPAASPPAPLPFSAAAAESTSAMPAIGLCMMLGSISAKMVLCAFPRLPAAVSVFMQCVLEISAGSKALIDLSPAYLLPVLSAACAFAGLSILMQNAAFWRESGVGIKSLFFLRIRHALFSALLTHLALFIL